MFRRYRNSQSYYQAKLPIAPTRPLLSSTKCDVCVVGAGYAGLSAALHIARSGREVVILESGSVGGGASGRNGGQVLPGYAREMKRLRRAVGDEQAYRLWGLSLEAVDLVSNLCKEYGLGTGPKQGHLTAALTPTHLADAVANLEDLQQTYGYEFARVIDKPQILGMIATDAYVGGVFDHGAGYLDPMALTNGLRRAAEAEGVRIFEQTRALTIANLSGHKSVTTSGGEVRSMEIVVAVNARIGDLLPPLGKKVLKAHTYMIATEPVSHLPIFRDDIAVADTNYVLDYFRPSNDGRLLYGGGISYFAPTEQTICRRLHGRMRKIFPQLDKTRIDYCWSGLLDLTFNRLPHIGRSPEGYFYTYGFSGHGIALAVLSGALIAEALAGNMERFGILASIPQPDYFRGVFHEGAQLFETTRYRWEQIWDEHFRT